MTRAGRHPRPYLTDWGFYSVKVPRRPSGDPGRPSSTPVSYRLRFLLSKSTPETVWWPGQAVIHARILQTEVSTQHVSHQWVINFIVLAPRVKIMVILWRGSPAQRLQFPWDIRKNREERTLNGKKSWWIDDMQFSLMRMRSFSFANPSKIRQTVQEFG